MALPYTPGYGYNPYQFGQMNPLQPQMDRLAQMQPQQLLRQIFREDLIIPQ